MKWVIEKDVFLEGNPERMAEIVRVQGMTCNVVRYIAGEPLGGIAEGQRVVVYGSIGFVRDVVMAARGNAIVWFDAEKFACHFYYERLKAFVLQRGFRFVTWGELEAHFEEFVADIGHDGKLFVRPDDCVKSFAGRVVDRGSFARWYGQNTKCYDLVSDLLCVIAEPQEILGEWRAVIADRSVISASAYVGEGREAVRAEVPMEVIVLAERITREFSFASLPVYVMDIGRTREGLFLMEIGCFNSSSLYHCDLEKVVRTVSEVANRAGVES